MLFKATIQILVDVNSEAEAGDCICETMRPLLREYAPDSCIIDWLYADGGPLADDGRDFGYASERSDTPQETASQSGNDRRRR